jgi:sugar/nucleoside kinase (ribokinase family)
MRSKEANNILAVGSVALDTVKTPFGEVKEVLGGSVTYFAFAASFFTNVNLVGVVGEDFPEEYLELLRSRKINLKGLEIREGKTFRWSGDYGYDLNQRETLSVELNVFEDFHPKLSPELSRSPYVFLANIDPELHLEVIKQIERPKLIVCDTMNIWIENKRSVLEKTLGFVDILVLNDSEARELAGEANLIKAGKSILKRGPKGVIIKKGEHGAVYFSKSSFFAIPAFPLESVYDPTGAGDSFAGGFLGYLAKEGGEEKNIKTAIVYGTIMASFTVEDFSLERLKTVTDEEIEKRFQQFKKMTHFGG